MWELDRLGDGETEDTMVSIECAEITQKACVYTHMYAHTHPPCPLLRPRMEGTERATDLSL